MKTAPVEIGAVYGKWTVLEDISCEQGGKKRRLLKVRCVCGKEATITKCKVLNGQSYSCRSCIRTGVLRPDLWKPTKEVCLMAIHASLKAAANRKKKTWTLTPESVMALVQEPCFYCGDPGGNTFKLMNREGSLAYNGLDRFDSSRGYEPGNVLPCCKYCNRMKSDLTHDEFFTRINRIFEKHGKAPAVVIAEPITS